MEAEEDEYEDGQEEHRRMGRKMMRGMGPATSPWAILGYATVGA